MKLTEEALAHVYFLHHTQENREPVNDYINLAGALSKAGCNSMCNQEL